MDEPVIVIGFENKDGYNNTGRNKTKMMQSGIEALQNKYNFNKLRNLWFDLYGFIKISYDYDFKIVNFLMTIGTPYNFSLVLKINRSC